MLGAMLTGVLAAASAAPSALPTSSLIVDTDHGPVTIKVEVAGDPASQERGLMYRTTMAPNAGMLFDFHQPRYVTFWMKNTVLSLDIIFIRRDGSISSIAPNAVPYSETSIPSAEPVRAVLELNGGRAAALGIEPDRRVRHAIFGNAVPGQK